MIKFLDNNKGTQFGLDLTYKVIPNSFRLYKMITLYCIDNNDSKILNAALIPLKYKDMNSFLKILSILKAIYIYSPKRITTYFDNVQIKELKNCDAFSTKPFHFS